MHDAFLNHAPDLDRASRSMIYFISFYFPPIAPAAGLALPADLRFHFYSAELTDRECGSQQNFFTQGSECVPVPSMEVGHCTTQ